MVGKMLNLSGCLMNRIVIRIRMFSVIEIVSVKLRRILGRGKISKIRMVMMLRVRLIFDCWVCFRSLEMFSLVLFCVMLVFVMGMCLFNV